MLELYCCELSAVDADLRERCRDLLNDDEQRRLQSFRRDEAAHAFVVARALLRSVLAEKLGCEPRSLRFIRDANDKPQLAGAALHFNVSHGGGWAVLAVSEAPVGVDIETSQRNTNLLGIARRFFQPAEYELLKALPDDARAQMFYELWTLKEACVKWCGLGIGRAIAGVGVAIVDGAITWTLRSDIAPDAAPGALLFAVAPAIRLAAVGDVGDWRLRKIVPLQAPQSLPAALLGCAP